MEINLDSIFYDSSSESLHPRDIFMSLPDKDSKYSYPRDIQTEVWNKWNEVRSEKNCIIKMNTGSGKTVVGLMILKSLIDEGKGPAVYVVPDNYLVSQVVKEAKKLGVKIAESENDYNYLNRNAILVINIHKLINGKSVFGMRSTNNIQIGSIIIDDVHACIDTINQQFTISILNEEKDGRNLYKNIVSVFRESIKNYSEQEYSDIIEQKNPNYNMLLPYWIWQNKQQEVYNILSTNRSDDSDIIFKLPLIKDTFKICNCCISSHKIEISPKAVDLSKIQSFNDAEHRIFMSATLADDSVFVSTVGLKETDIKQIITPEKANDIGDRIMLFPQLLNSQIDEKELMDKIKSTFNGYNTVVLTPSFEKAKRWEKYADRCLSSKDGNIESGVEELRSGTAKGLTVIVNKYDGIDLPDDACSILVVDDLPNMESEYDKLLYTYNSHDKQLLKRQIQKVEQGIGRGVRSNNDHCVIIFMGSKLTNILIGMRGTEYFSEATRKQFEISDKIWNQIKEQNENPSIEDILSVSRYVLEKNPGWLQNSKKALADINYRKEINIDEATIAMRNAFEYFRIDQYENAFSEIEKYKNTLTEEKTVGYYMQIMAEYKNLTDPLEAQHLQSIAKSKNSGLLSPIKGLEYKKTLFTTEQTNFFNNYLSSNNITKDNFVLNINSILEDLVLVDKKANVFEKALNDIAKLIGYDSSRPEAEINKGPDNIWCITNGKYLVIECKSEATSDSISKTYCNQLNGSINWFNNEYSGNGFECIPIMIHNSNHFDYDCSPNPKIRIMTPTKFDELKKAIKDFSIAYSAGNYQQNQELAKLFKHYSLTPDKIVEKYTENYIIDPQKRRDSHK